MTPRERVPGGDFDVAWSTHEARVVETTVVRVVGREQLVALKRASGRPEDLVDAGRLDGGPR